MLGVWLNCLEIDGWLGLQGLEGGGLRAQGGGSMVLVSVYRTPPGKRSRRWEYLNSCHLTAWSHPTEGAGGFTFILYIRQI